MLLNVGFMTSAVMIPTYPPMDLPVCPHTPHFFEYHSLSVLAVLLGNPYNGALVTWWLLFLKQKGAWGYGHAKITTEGRGGGHSPIPREGAASVFQ